MKRQVDENMPIGKLTRVKDFLPPPEKLGFPTKGQIAQHKKMLAKLLRARRKKK